MCEICVPGDIRIWQFLLWNSNMDEKTKNMGVKFAERNVILT